MWRLVIALGGPNPDPVDGKTRAISCQESREGLVPPVRLAGSWEFPLQPRANTSRARCMRSKRAIVCRPMARTAENPFGHDGAVTRTNQLSSKYGDENQFQCAKKGYLQEMEGGSPHSQWKNCIRFMRPRWRPPSIMLAGTSLHPRRGGLVAF
jgi:hypothetical protein